MDVEGGAPERVMSDLAFLRNEDARSARPVVGDRVLKDEQASGEVGEPADPLPCTKEHEGILGVPGPFRGKRSVNCESGVLEGLTVEGDDRMSP